MVEQNNKPILSDSEKLRKMKGIVVLLVVIVAILAAVLVLNMGRATKAANAGWNMCAQECNKKIDTLKSQCIISDIKIDNVQDTQIPDAQLIDINNGD